MSRLFIPQNPEQQKMVAQWAAEQIPWLKSGDAFGPCTAWGIMKVVEANPVLVGAFIFNNFRPEIGDIELNVITQESGWASKNIMETVADYVFNQLKCKRMSCTLPKGARKHREHALQVGFKMEGVKRGGFFNGVDAMLYGMLRGECVFLVEQKAAA